MSFHFLRPEWLWLMIPTALVWWGLWKSEKTSGLWQSIIDPVFQKVLLEETPSQGNDRQLALFGLGLLWLISLIALAGPTWNEIKQPAEKGRNGTVILLDTSLSMLADDLKPNRMSRAKFKLTDLLKSHPEMSTGLVVYAGSAHTLVPISEDNQTLLALLKSISPLLMPSPGSNPKAGIEKALELMKGAHIKQGHLIWVLDDIESDQIAPIAQALKSAHTSVSLLAVGTQTGGPIALPEQGLLKDHDGKIVLAKLPFDRLRSLAREVGASLTLIQNNDSDLDALLPSRFETFEADAKQSSDRQLSQWLDYGIYLLIFLLPLAALGFRKGYLFILAPLCFLPGLVVFPSPAAANEKSPTDLNSSFLDIFKSPDQQGYEYWSKKQYEAALDRFETPEWKGASLYRLGKYQEAAKQFGQVPTAEGHFNQGNALAQMGALEKAKAEYLEALKLQPGWQAAEDNLNLMKKLLAQRTEQTPKQSPMKSPMNSTQQSAQNASRSPSDDQKDPQTANQGSQNLSRQSPAREKPSERNSTAKNNAQASSQSGLSQQNSSNPSRGNESALNTNKDALAQDSKAEREQKNNPDNKSKEQNAQTLENQASRTTIEGDSKKNAKPSFTEKEQARQAWLNQIPDEPGLFLQRKFEYQYQLQPNHPPPDKVW